MDDFVRQRTFQSFHQKLLWSPIELPCSWKRQYGLGELMINERNAHFQALRHTHNIGVAQKRVQHITARLQIGNAVDGIQRTSALQPVTDRMRGQFSYTGVPAAYQQVALPRRK